MMDATATQFLALVMSPLMETAHLGERSPEKVEEAQSPVHEHEPSWLCSPALKEKEMKSNEL